MGQAVSRPVGEGKEEALVTNLLSGIQRQTFGLGRTRNCPEKEKRLHRKGKVGASAGNKVVGQKGNNLKKYQGEGSGKGP